jgi:MYXO-CTERM domain-containing protein
MNAHCRNGLCLEDQGAHYCSHECTTHVDCPDGFHCRSGYCVRGYIGADGDPCITSDDCGAPTTCYDDGTWAYCTQMGCEGGTPCPSYMTCTMVGQTGVCTLGVAPAGNPCDANGQCLSGGCLRFDGQGICTLTCDREMPCPAGTYCTESDSGVLACAPNSMPPTNPDVDPPGGSNGGCATGGAPAASWLWLGLLLLALRRRRK